MFLSSCLKVFGTRWNAEWVSVLRWSMLSRRSRSSDLIHPVALLMIVGVWRHSGTTKSVFQLNRSGGKCGTTDAVFFHWTVRRKEVALNGFWIWFFKRYEYGDCRNKLCSLAILKGVAFPWERKGKRNVICWGLYPTGYTWRCNCNLSHFQNSFVSRLTPQTVSSMCVL